MSIKEAIEAIDGVEDAMITDNPTDMITIWVDPNTTRDPAELITEIDDVRPAMFEGHMTTSRGSVVFKYYRQL